MEVDEYEIDRITTNGLITGVSDTSGEFTVNTADFSGYDLALIIGNTINDIGVEASPHIIADSLSLNAATGIGTSNNPLNTEVTTLSAETTDDNAGIYIEEEDDLVVDTITAGTLADRGDVALTVGGGISDIAEAETITADTLTLTALSGIGTSNNPLNTEVTTLSAETTDDNAGIYIEEFDGVNIDTLTAGGNATITANGSSALNSITTDGNFSFTTLTGAITIVLTGTVTSTGGGVSLIADDGSIFAIGDGPHLVAANDSLLEAGGVIASSVELVNPFDVKLTNGNLEVTIGSAIDGVSGVLTSEETPSVTLLVNDAPPGIVYFNGSQIWPPSTTGASPELISESAHALVWRWIMYHLERLAMYRMNSFDAAGPVYFYQPLTEMEMVAFEELIVDEDAYEFIDGVLNIIGHEGILSIFEEI